MLPVKEFNKIVDFKTYFDWQDQLISNALTFGVDYNNNPVSDPNNVFSSIVWNTIDIRQDRTNGNDMCNKIKNMNHPIAQESLYNIMYLQGLDCHDPLTKNGITFGREINVTSLEFQNCPHFPTNHSKDGINPFQPFVSNIPSFQNKILPDPREGYYVYLANSPDRAEKIFKLRNCNWLDLRSRKVTVDLVFWDVATQEIGLINHMIEFDYLGRATPTLTIDMADFRDMTRDLSTQYPSIDPSITTRAWSVSLLAFSSMHKAILQVTSILFPIILF